MMNTNRNCSSDLIQSANRFSLFRRCPTIPFLVLITALLMTRPANGQSSAGTTVGPTSSLVGTTSSIQGHIDNLGTVQFNQASSGTFAGTISDIGTVQITGTGPITCTGPNTYSGGTTIDAGSTLFGTTSSLQGSMNNSGIVGFNQTTSGTYSGVISGTGVVDILGTGPVTFSGNNTYSGGTLVAAGAVLTGTTNSIQGTILDLGTIKFDQTTSGTYAGVIVGNGLVEISGTGPVTFTGMNLYVGGTLVDQNSTLIGTTSSLQGQITNNGFLTFNQTTSGTFNGTLGGTGHVEISGNGPVTLSNLNTYSGGTTVDSGSLLIGSTTSLQGAIVNNGAIQFNQSVAGSYTGNLSGAGTVEISGTAPVIFSGLNNYTGGTTVDNGSTLMGTTTGIQGRITNNGAVQFNSSAIGSYNGSMSGTGSVEIASSAYVTLGGNNSYSGGTTVDSGGTLVGTTASLQGNIVDNGLLKFNSFNFVSSDPIMQPLSPAVSSSLQLPQNVVLPPIFVTSNNYAGNISGTGRVEIGGNGTTMFSGINTYTGGTTVDAGSTLTGSTYSVQGNITNNGFVQFANLPPQYTGVTYPIGFVSDSMVAGSAFGLAGTYAGNMSGSGSVEVSGLAPITFTGTNSYRGGTTVDLGSELIGTTNSLQGTFSNSGNVQFSQSTSGTYAGNMSGLGSVTIAGSGPVTFSGTNSYQGGTTINSGSTLIGTTNGLQGSILNNGHLEFNQTTYGAYRDSITGTGGVEIGGVGPVMFLGTNTYTGGTTIDNGSTLTVIGSIVGNVDVNNGGTITAAGFGLGSVGNLNVHAGGTISPGGPMAGATSFAIVAGQPAPQPTYYDNVLTVNGNLNQGTGSAYTVELNSTASSKIAVNGTAQIGTGTTLNLTVDPGTLSVGHHYEILSSTGNLTGRYTSVLPSSFSQDVVFTEQYNPNDLQLIVNSNLSQFARTANQSAIASAIDQSSGIATGAYANAITQLTTLGSSQLSSALNQLSGGIYPSIGAVERQTTTAQMQLLSNRLAGLTAPGTPGPSVAQQSNGMRLVSRQLSNALMSSALTGNDSNGAITPSRQQSWTTWGQGYALGGNIAGDGNAAGVNYRLGGTLFGVERWLGESTLVGVLGGYAGTSIKDRQDGSTAQINSYQVGLYELHHTEFLYVSNIDAFSNNSSNVSRPLNFGTIQQTVTGSSGGNQWAHYTELGKTIDIDEFRIQPFAGIQYMYLDQRGDTESGAGSLDLTTGHQIVNSTRSSLGARLYQEMMWGNTLVVPSLSARYQHEFGNGTQLITSTLAGAPTAQFTTAGANTGRDFGLFTLGATAYINEHFSVYGTVDAQVASGYSAVIGSGGLQYSW